MNKLFWLINVSLLLVAILVTTAVASSKSKTATVQEVDAGSERKRAEPSSRMSQVSPSTVGAATDDTDVLWQKSLFRPDRTEEESSNSEEVTGPANQAADGMELIGIGVIGTESAAIILTKEAGPVPPMRAAFTGPKAGGSGKPAEKDKTPAVKTQHIYKLGQVVGLTGFKVKEIKLAEVILAKGAEERTLKLEKGDAASKTRSESAAAAATRTAAAAATTSPPIPPSMPGAVHPGFAGANAPPPPPPIPMPAVPAVANPALPVAVDQATKDERIKTALEARRRIMDKRQHK